VCRILRLSWKRTRCALGARRLLTLAVGLTPLSAYLADSGGKWWALAVNMPACGRRGHCWLSPAIPFSLDAAPLRGATSRHARAIFVFAGCAGVVVRCGAGASVKILPETQVAAAPLLFFVRRGVRLWRAARTRVAKGRASGGWRLLYNALACGIWYGVKSRRVRRRISAGLFYSAAGERYAAL